MSRQTVRSSIDICDAVRVDPGVLSGRAAACADRWSRTTSDRRRHVRGRRGVVRGSRRMLALSETSVSESFPAWTHRSA